MSLVSAKSRPSLAKSSWVGMRRHVVVWNCHFVPMKVLLSAYFSVHWSFKQTKPDYSNIMFLAIPVSQSSSTSLPKCSRTSTLRALKHRKPLGSTTSLTKSNWVKHMLLVCCVVIKSGWFKSRGGFHLNPVSKITSWMYSVVICHLADFEISRLLEVQNSEKLFLSGKCR